MTLGLYIRLIIYIILAFGILTLVQRPVRKSKHRFVPVLVFLIKALAAVYLALVLIAIDYPLVWKHGYPFGALYLALMADVGKDILCFIIYLFRRKPLSEKRNVIIGIALTLLFSLWNVVNMQVILPNEHVIGSEKLDQTYKLVFLADLHYGSSQSPKTVDRALEEIAELHPDYLLLGGDITDEYTTKEEMEYIYEKIGALDLPTYFIYGNHDRQERGEEMLGEKEYSDEELEAAIAGNGIRILKEEAVEVNEDLVLLGREDPSHPDQRKAVKDLPALPEDRYSIALDHTPYQNDEIRELKADLQLSGHTHAAQYFPVMTIYKLMHLNVYGDYFIGDTHLYVSSGISGWCLPLRSEARCNYEVITLKSE